VGNTYQFQEISTNNTTWRCTTVQVYAQIVVASAFSQINQIVKKWLPVMQQISEAKRG
jgi:hypothetical protein